MTGNPIPCLRCRRELAYLINRAICPFGLYMPPIGRLILTRLKDGPERIGVGGAHADALYSTARGCPQFAFLGASLQKRVRMSDLVLEFTVRALRKSSDDHVDPVWSVAITHPESHTLADTKFVRVHSQSSKSRARSPRRSDLPPVL
jgi:hypothetical protein